MLNLNTIRAIRSGITALWLVTTLSGCADPCAELEERVCARDEDERSCELLQDPMRRDLLSGEACQSILDHTGRR